MEISMESATLHRLLWKALCKVRERRKQFSTFRCACLALQEALEEENKARIEQAKKMDLLIKRMDHTERARRENEAPLLQEAYAQKVKVAFLCFVALMLTVYDAQHVSQAVPKSNSCISLTGKFDFSNSSQRCCLVLPAEQPFAHGLLGDRYHFELVHGNVLYLQGCSILHSSAMQHQL